MKQFLCACLASLAISAVFAAEPISRRDAARLQAKLDQITRNGTTRRLAGARTAITEAELNSYLRYELADRIPPGVSDPSVELLDEGRLAGKATVDLAQVSNGRKSAGSLDPFALLRGSLPVTINGVLRTKNGVGTFALESAAISGVPVPVWMLQEIVSYYSKSDTSPLGVSIEKPFVLPSGIREIQLGRGQAIVIQ